MQCVILEWIQDQEKKKIAMKGITEAMTKFENGLWIR